MAVEIIFLRGNKGIWKRIFLIRIKKKKVTVQPPLKFLVVITDVLMVANIKNVTFFCLSTKVIHQQAFFAPCFSKDKLAQGRIVGKILKKARNVTQSTCFSTFLFRFILPVPNHIHSHSDKLKRDILSCYAA